MIEKWFEAFTLMKAESASDNHGGTTTLYTPDVPFRGALTLVAGEEIPMGGRPVLQENPVLLHELDVTLVPGDRVRREKDGAIYRVGGRSDGMRAPAWSGLQFAQVPVERVVL